MSPCESTKSAGPVDICEERMRNDEKTNRAEVVIAKKIIRRARNGI